MRDPASGGERSVAATLLAPVGACYGAIAARRMGAWRKAGAGHLRWKFHVGGAGKTPTAVALGRYCASGHRPFFLSRARRADRRSVRASVSTR